MAMFTTYFSSTIFAQEMVSGVAGTSSPLWQQLGVSGTLSAIAIAATVHCFKAYKKVQEDRIIDLKEHQAKAEIEKKELLAVLQDLRDRH